jgi:hypothetical protein
MKRRLANNGLRRAWKKHPRPNLGEYPGVCLHPLKIATENLSGVQSRDWDLKPGPAEYERLVPSRPPPSELHQVLLGLMNELIN